ncbi:hypothetical protein DIU31_022595 [Mucilaginibacter rubeus]|uniref:Uncharacterized protein n=2 Tax=Mucilaginibacter rubeus TaxID=2027860 RepID=A0A364WX06_9SPHI|nr:MULTISPECIES: hypothetical protein [Mucilaginibacter]QEM06167.1 hypothetical protein DIU31_022595 [Mucilaginibacter rubeus]QEM13684.1 hypothetical protein DEO27_027950 [Mucilaginibacter rubeus]QEM18749.1 hypothetical protein DIU38_022830 [Mucilaginibacter gossypii]QTE36257.1 hypothetical protein J3L18_24470 [Mucilaginibacter gossypii]QTE44710.1 hypothetical protein J3L19_04895 [Mucilaginibacter rubeus]
METNHSDHSQTPLKDLEPEVKAKALEIEGQLKDSDIPEGCTREEEAVKRAQQWFLDMEG